MIDAIPGDIFRRGQVLNNTYEIEGVLGRGGTGEVYRAKNQITGRVVAIKALSKQFSGNDDYIELMKREEEMRDIHHDSVVRYTECSRSDQGHVFLVMDFIDGPSLNEVMASRRMDPRELMIVAHRVAEGLEAAQRHGIVHRDLSPDNVILRDGRAERATIIDFGIAKDTTAGALTIVGNEFAGKYEYAAPEQVDGRADTRSDFYALGASILAAWRGDVPFAGSTPGEIVRRKQMPLDTEGVPDPLKGLIDWLTAPDPRNRPQKASEIIARLDAALKSGRGPALEVPQKKREGRRGRGWLLVPLFAVLAAAAYFTVNYRDFFPEPLPIADPFRLTAAAASDGAAQFEGNAPDAASAERLAAAYAEATGATPSTEALSLAQGVPFEAWADAVGEAFAIMPGLEDWRLDMAGRAAVVQGLAPGGAERSALISELDAWAGRHDIALAAKIAAGPRVLEADAVAGILKGLADCGTLTIDRAEGGSYALGDTVRVTGFTTTEDTAARIVARLSEAVGDRRVAVETTALNADLCNVRQVLPIVPSNALSIWFGDGSTGAANLSGIYRAGENPIVEVHAPAGLAAASLWVVLVDNTGKVFNLLPNMGSEEQKIDALGQVENGVRRVRVLHSIDEFRQDNSLMAMRISDSDFGKSEIVAILSKSNLFKMRGPTSESIASFVESLTEIQSEQPGNIIGVASRLLDSRP
ncbi:Serine/threonine-protein kinase PknL [Defluviimonas aquaemixtae]|uniref:Serine/threonine-protein kinase PknL n=1 Tax=Albidovulum aquaemixtae TaxID=1542388 RepID=A0A2R8B890_9RHOB|nr:serine/threonine-protein kinase [Defluviimonas aquaemixtae]SPH18703.1 Serine/threonine-protein kinase PknL [Defluviimonas aquaemixtae]